MLFTWPKAVAGLCLIALSACQTGPMTPPPPPPPGQPVIFPASDPFVLRDRSSTSQSILGDGSLSTTTSSSKVSVDPSALMGALLGQAGVPAGTFATTAQIAGVWKVQQPDGAICTMILRDRQIGTGLIANQSGCSDPRMVNARTWSLAGGNLRVTSADGRVADLKVQAMNRAEGSGFVFWR
jgi:hypothetical protein